MERHTFSTGELMKRINERLEKKANRELQSQNNITVTQFKMLMILHHTPTGTATLKEMEKYFGIAQSTAAGIALRLEKKKLVVRFGDPYDKRVKHIQITDAGREICSVAHDSMAANEAQLLAGLTLDERKELNMLLQKLYDTMK